MSDEKLLPKIYKNTKTTIKKMNDWIKNGSGAPEGLSRLIT